MGCFVGRKGVCAQGPPITALAWGVKQIDWQANGSQFQTLWSSFIPHSFNTELRKCCREQGERLGLRQTQRNHNGALV